MPIDVTLYKCCYEVKVRKDVFNLDDGTECTNLGVVKSIVRGKYVTLLPKHGARRIRGRSTVFEKHQ